MRNPIGFIVAAALTAAGVCACAPMGAPDAGADAPDAGGAVPSCEEEDDCASLGAGHMCMGGMCMVMDVLAPAVAIATPAERDVAVPTLTDLDPDPGVFEATLVAAERDVELVDGVATPAWVYLETEASAPRVPGPMIDVVAGTRVKIHFTNQLPQETTIHWHGLVLPDDMDGAPNEASSIAPGESFTFDFVARDAAFYWFHPHLFGDVQIERGLYGLFLVRDADEPLVDAERFFALDDVLLQDDGAVAPPDEGPAHSEDGRMTFVSMMGRQGNHLLVNGKENPIVDVQPGALERWRVVVPANARFFKLALPGHVFLVIGTDGGLVDEPYETSELLMSPGERYDVLVRMDGAPGDEVALVTKHYDRGHDIADPGDLPLLLLRYGPTPVATRLPVPETSGAIDALPVPDLVAHRLVMGEDLLRGAKVGFTFNEERWPDVTPRTARLGDTELWEIANDTHMDHPFHLHGFRFQVVGQEPLAWKDTVIVPPQASLRFVVRYDGFAGEWMAHCHILEHAERGMMTMLMVEQ